MRRWLITCVFLCAPAWADNPPPPQTTALISIIIDDLGYRYRTSLRAVHSPYALSCSFLPHSPYANTLARQAWLLNKDVLVHLPMEADSGKAIGPGGLYQDMPRQRFERTVLESIRAVPHAIGINNHMGSRLTRNHIAMDWLMQQVARHSNLFFIDSRTTRHSQAMFYARRNGVLSTGRDVFLDHVVETHAIRRQFRRLIWQAQKTGSAVAIGHPHPQTLDVLEQALPQLAQMGVKLVPISQLVMVRSIRRLAWQRSSFPLPKVVKN